jgi:hypothetical protein
MDCFWQQPEVCTALAGRPGICLSRPISRWRVESRKGRCDSCAQSWLLVGAVKVWTKSQRSVSRLAPTPTDLYLNRARASWVVSQTSFRSSFGFWHFRRLRLGLSFAPSTTSIAASRRLDSHYCLFRLLAFPRQTSHHLAVAMVHTPRAKPVLEIMYLRPASD